MTEFIITAFVLLSFFTGGYLFCLTMQDNDVDGSVIEPHFDRNGKIKGFRRKV